MNAAVCCRYCHTEVEGSTRAEAREDAANLGWQLYPRGPVCGDCLNEQDTQR